MKRKLRTRFGEVVLPKKLKYGSRIRKLTSKVKKAHRGYDRAKTASKQGKRSKSVQGARSRLSKYIGG